MAEMPPEAHRRFSNEIFTTMQKLTPSEANEAWWRQREAAAVTRPGRGRNRSRVTGERLAAMRVTVGTAYRVLHKWDNVASYYDISKAAAYRIANDDRYHPSESVAQRIEERSIPRPTTAPVAVCPDCGEPHTAQERCNGDPVEVVLLRPGQKVTTRKQRQYQRIADMPKNVLAFKVKRRVDYVSNG